MGQGRARTTGAKAFLIHLSHQGVCWQGTIRKKYAVTRGDLHGSRPTASVGRDRADLVDLIGRLHLLGPAFDVFDDGRRRHIDAALEIDRIIDEALGRVRSRARRSSAL